MALSTVTVNCHFYDADGLPIDNATVNVFLSKYDTDINGIIIPEVLGAITDSQGFCTFNLWANSRGFRQSKYHFEIKKGENVHTLEPVFIKHKDDNDNPITEVNLRELDPSTGKITFIEYSDYRDDMLEDVARAEKAADDAEALYGDLQAVEAAKNEAQQAAQDAEDLYGDLTAVQTAKDQAVAASNAAAGSEAAAGISENNSFTSEVNARNYRDQSESAKQASETARDQSIQAKTDSESAKNSSAESAAVAATAEQETEQHKQAAKVSQDQSELSATASASSAAEAATSAAGAAADATAAANDRSRAEAARATAETKATESGNSASASSQAKIDSQVARDQSETAKNESQGHAINSSDSAASALDSANRANTSAVSASNSAQDALNSETAARGHKEQTQLIKDTIEATQAIGSTGEYSVMDTYDDLALGLNMGSIENNVVGFPKEYGAFITANHNLNRGFQLAGYKNGALYVRGIEGAAFGGLNDWFEVWTGLSAPIATIQGDNGITLSKSSNTLTISKELEYATLYKNATGLGGGQIVLSQPITNFAHIVVIGAPDHKDYTVIYTWDVTSFIENQTVADYDRRHLIWSGIGYYWIVNIQTDMKTLATYSGNENGVIWEIRGYH